MEAVRRLHGGEPSHRAGVEQLGTGKVVERALHAVRIVGEQAEPLRRAARLDLGTVVREALVVALGLGADRGGEIGGRCERRDGGDERGILGGDELGGLLGDGAETEVVVDRLGERAGVVGGGDHSEDSFRPCSGLEVGTEAAPSAEASGEERRLRVMITGTPFGRGQRAACDRRRRAGRARAGRYAGRRGAPRRS